MTQSAATRLRVGLVVLGGLAVLALATLLWTQVVEPRVNRSIADTLGEGDYRLRATDGTEFTEASLRGAPSAVFFGFTHCPEVCPTTLGEIAGWQEELAGMGKELRVFFVTVDPERDTIDMLGDYVSWVPGVVGVSGSPDEIAKAIKAFRIFASKVPLNDGGYTMDHSASLLLFDARGRFVEPIGYGEDPTRAVDKLARLVSP